MEDQEYLIVNQYVTKDGDTKLEYGNYDGKILFRQTIGLNSDVYILNNHNYELKFSISKINNVYYININGQHLIDYKKFTIETITDSILTGSVKITGIFGEIIIENCDTILFKKMLKIIDEILKPKMHFFYNLSYYSKRFSLF